MAKSQEPTAPQRSARTFLPNDDFVPPEFQRSFSPIEAQQKLAVKKTRMAEIIRMQEVQSYLDGKSRKIWGPSLYRRIVRKLQEQATEPLPPYRAKRRRGPRL